MKPIVSINGVSKGYDGMCVLNDVTLDIFSSDIISVTGHNGAGKTTLLRILNLLDEPDCGELSFDSTVFGEDRLCIRRRMAMVLQKPVVFNASVYDNVAYGLRIRGVDGGLASMRVRETLSMVGLSEPAKNALRLSGGEAQRVALARCIVLEPALLILDEPTANLDPASARVVEDAILRMRREYKMAVVMATHDVSQTRRLSGRIVLMSGGKAVERGA